MKREALAKGLIRITHKYYPTQLILDCEQQYRREYVANRKSSCSSRTSTTYCHVLFGRL